MNPSLPAFTAPRLIFALAIGVAIGIGCSPTEGPPAGSGGATGVGGIPGPASGGANPGSGGATGVGGTATTGGQTGNGTGGASATGGSESGTGGSVNIVGTIDDLTVTPNPNSVLSVYVSWTTTEPSSSVVQFGEGSLTWQITGPENVTEHEVLVIGLHASSAYMLHALSTGASGTVAGDTEFATEALPPEVPEGTVSVNDTALRQPGWTLMNVQKGNGEPGAYATAPGVAAIYDEEGKPVWYWINGSVVERGGAISVDRTDVGVLMGPVQNIPNMVTAPTEVDWAGDLVWTCTNAMCGGTALMSHHAGKLSNGNYTIMRDASIGGRTSQIFEEWTAANQQVFSIGVEDLVTPPGGAANDWAHGNSITIDLEEDVAYLSFRWLGLMKATYSTKEIQWHLPANPAGGGVPLGGDDVTSSPKMAFDPPSSQFSDIHDPEIHDDGTILFFDNGGFTGSIAEGNPGNLHTRAVEYAIDEAGPTATLVWEWPGDFPVDAWYTTDLYVPFWGDADRLANGNVMITAGRRGTGAQTPESRIIEVDKETGAVVWELKLPKDHGVYRSERITPPLVTAVTP